MNVIRLTHEKKIRSHLRINQIKMKAKKDKQRRKLTTLTIKIKFIKLLQITWDKFISLSL